MLNAYRAWIMVPFAFPSKRLRADRGYIPGLPEKYKELFQVLGIRVIELLFYSVSRIEAVIFQVDTEFSKY
jgi:hypothetical protein